MLWFIGKENRDGFEHPYKKSLVFTINYNFSAFSGENKEKPLVFALAQITASSVTAYALLLDIHQVFC